MIDVSMTSPSGVTLDTAGKYCADAVRVTPAFDFAEKARRWTVEVPAELVGAGVLFTDGWIARHYDDPDLVLSITPIRYELPTAQRFVGGFVSSRNMAKTGSAYGMLVRVMADGSATALTVYEPSHLSTGSYRFSIDSEGQFKVNSGICAGTYSVIAHIM